ncbi:MAG TPA: sigma-70 family RNA polymerase sigma factor [Planctomycetes bacterium]|nr:sigma-70 family RNA polymerase sigma factor [Planctomycetota bacterium]
MPGAFEELALPLADRIFSLLAGMAGATDAEDLLQETLLKAYRGIRGFRGGSAFATWLTRIAINTARSHARKKRPVSMSEFSAGDADDTDADPLDTLPGTVADPSDAIEMDERRKRLETAMGSLSGDDREILLLREVEGQSYEEIAHTLEMSEAAVRSKLHRARRRILVLLGGRGA